jgi:hypothetical protein
MAYFHTSTQTAAERRDEATRILAMLRDVDLARCTSTERAFLDRLRSDPEEAISPRQLFWLRDLKDKYLDGPTGQEALFG